MPAPTPIDPELLNYCKTDRQREVVNAIIGTGGNMRAASHGLGIRPDTMSRHRTTIENQAREAGYEPAAKLYQNRFEQVEVDRAVADGNFHRLSKSAVKKSQTYLFTWAQNATPVHPGFWAALTRCADELGAELYVIPGRYRNPTSRWTEAQEGDEYWCPQVAPYLLDGRVLIGEHLVVMGDIKIQPTAQRPLSGLQSMSSSRSAIFGHPKLEFETIATMHDRLPKILTTTGACTVENYTDSKAGKKGEFHHVIGAALVELDDGLFHVRQVNAMDDGSFIDLETEYTPEGSRPAPDALALVMGDIHAEFMDPDVERATLLNKDSMVNTLRPGSIVLHDWYDGYSGSHHHRGKPFTVYAKHHAGRHNVEQEVRRTFERTRSWLRDGIEYYIVGSNHNEHLVRWLELGEPKNDPENALFYHRLIVKVLEQTRMGRSGAEVPNPLALLAPEMLPEAKNLHFIGRDDSLTFAGIECAQHGDKGANGARGNRDVWSRAGMKTITGHAHGPFIRDGAMGVGTSSLLRLEYNDGLSNWLHTHAVIYANGKRALLSIIGGKWRSRRRRVRNS